MNIRGIFCNTALLVLASACALANGGAHRQTSATASNRATSNPSSQPNKFHLGKTYSFLGKVLSVGFPQKPMQAIPIGFDARWIVTIHIEESSDPAPGLEPGREVNFLVHSPTLLFGMDYQTTLIKRFRFSLTVRGTNEQMLLSLDAKPE